MTYRSKVAAVYLLGFFLDLINMFIASVAFPAMAHAFNTTPSALAWVSNGYIAGLTLVIPFSSVLTRRIGPKRVILLSLFLFSAASAAAGLSATLESLIAWRVIQGVRVYAGGHRPGRCAGTCRRAAYAGHGARFQPEHRSCGCPG